MFFGLIKTKKDKKIEELQVELDRLKTITMPPQFVYREANVVTLVADYAVPFEALEQVPEEHIKRVLTNKMLDVVEDNLDIEDSDDMYRMIKLFRAKLKVVIDK